MPHLLLVLQDLEVNLLSCGRIFGMERSTVRSAQEIRDKFNKKYGRLVNHFKRWQLPQPDANVDPKSFTKWSKSRMVIEHMLRLNHHDLYDGCPRAYRLLSGEGDYDEYRLWGILRRLASPINQRLDTMLDSQRKRNWVESPTNAKQTVRAIEQINDRLTQRSDPTPDRYGFELDELESTLESGGGFLLDGSYIEFNQSELEDLKQRVEAKRLVMKKGALIVDLMGPEAKEKLEQQRIKYFELLPPHYQEELRLLRDHTPTT